jgi:hypothetical protein
VAVVCYLPFSIFFSGRNIHGKTALEIARTEEMQEALKQPSLVLQNMDVTQVGIQ